MECDQCTLEDRGDGDGDAGDIPQIEVNWGYQTCRSARRRAEAASEEKRAETGEEQERAGGGARGRAGTGEGEEGAEQGISGRVARRNFGWKP